MLAVRGVDQLRGYAHPVAGLAYDVTDEVEGQQQRDGQHTVRNKAAAGKPQVQGAVSRSLRPITITVPFWIVVEGGLSFLGLSIGQQ